MATQRSPARVPQVLDHPSWKTKHHTLTLKERAYLSYGRARQVGLAHNLSKTDLLSLSPKFWDLHTDPITCMDGAATTLLTIQYNLCAGTIAMYSKGRPELDSLVEDLLKFRKLGQYMLTEVGHGLDIDNLESTATAQPDGSFIFTCPTPSASKYMPPTVPGGVPMIAVVFARLIVKGEDWGVRPFIVPINDGKQMCTGVTAQLLPYRELSCPVNHSITTFKNIRLPAGALLGPFSKSKNPQLDFNKSIWRIAVGSIALGTLAVPGTKIHTYIAGKYSLRRQVGNPENRVSLLAFRTQQIPVLNAVAQNYVVDAFQRWAAATFSNTKEDLRVRHAIAIVFKTVGVQIHQGIALSLSERCGAQGVQAINSMINLHAEMRGIAIAEGDILVLCIRLATELLLERYHLPESPSPNSLLAQHEAGLLTYYRKIIRSAPHHRDEEVNKRVLPHCQRIIEAIGHRMAYDAACAPNSGVSPDLCALFETSIVALDSAWYAENVSLGGKKFGIDAQEDYQALALDRVLPNVEQYLDKLEVESYVTAPIASEEKWGEFVDNLEVFRGRGYVHLDYGGAVQAHL